MLDRKISIAEELIPAVRQVQEKVSPPAENPSVPEKQVCAQALTLKLQSNSALFLLCLRDLLDLDVLLAQKVMVLYEAFRQVQEAVCRPDSNPKPEWDPLDAVFPGCTGMKAGQRTEAFDDCFPVGEFHIQLDTGKQIALLHLLRSGLRETALPLAQCDSGNGAAGQLNRIINALNYLICLSVGGKECQR